MSRDKESKEDEQMSRPVDRGVPGDLRCGMTRPVRAVCCRGRPRFVVDLQAKLHALLETVARER